MKWFQSYLSDRTQRCNVNGNLSTFSTVSCGVPQGSILGPLLFLMYINDLHNCLRDAAPRMFADDTNRTLSAKTVADLKLAVTSERNNLTCWLRPNRLSLNVAFSHSSLIALDNQTLLSKATPNLLKKAFLQVSVQTVGE